MHWSEGQWAEVKVGWDFLSHTCVSALLTPEGFAALLVHSALQESHAVAQLCFLIKLNLENNFFSRLMPE